MAFDITPRRGPRGRTQLERPICAARDAVSRRCWPGKAPACSCNGFELEAAEWVARELREAGGDAQALSRDIRTPAGADASAERCLELAGRVDVLVNNYGVAEGRGWLDGDDGDSLNLFHKNVLSGVRLVRRLLLGMRERGFGRVVFVSTMGATRPRAVLLARAHRRGWEGAWEQLAPRIARELLEILAGDPEDVGHLVAFLASARARYVSGANLRIDGGVTSTVN